MRSLLLPAATLVAITLASPADAVPGGRLATLAVGRWSCELPGDAEVTPTLVPAESFFAIKDSSYVLADGRGGTYLLLGDQLAMTSGPFDGKRYKLEGEGALHLLDGAGKETQTRCVRGIDPAAIGGNAPGQLLPTKPVPVAPAPAAATN